MISHAAPVLAARSPSARSFPRAPVGRTNGAVPILLTLLAALCPTDLLTAAPWLTFTEVCYRPPGDEELEFVEIYNLEAPGVDLGGWRLEGQVEFEFPRGLRIAPRECLVVARDVAAFKKRYPEVDVVGPFRGRLDNDGGRMVLRNRVGAMAAEMRYGREDAWPALADGTGHTLVLADALLDAREPGSWKPSEEIGGSPGDFEQKFRRVPGKLIVRRGEEWKFFRGTEQPPEGWSAAELDDSTWETGKSGFGYGDDDDETRLEDMPGRYVALFTRKTFSVDDPAAAGLLTLLVDYDDGFVAYLNGKEVARANVGAPGNPEGDVAWNQPAFGSREAGRSQPFPIGDSGRWLREGKNVLAVAGFNSSLASSDFSLIVELESRRRVDPPGPTRRTAARINEVALRSGESGRALEWIELHNPSLVPLDLGGFFLGDEPTRPAKWKIPAGTTIDAGGLAVLTAKQLGADALAGPVVFLTAADGERIVDALSTRGVPGETGTTAVSVGRHPDGAGQTRVLARGTPGAANDLTLASDVVINEISYHPSSDEPAEEYIVLHNRGSLPAPLEGLHLRGGVRYEFPAGATIPPRGFTVVARDPEALAAKHGIARERVVGPFTGGLSNRGEEIRLSDALGRTVDLVSFADRAPWPRAADGWGSSLELVDARLDNALAGAWAASDESRGSEWRQVSYEAGVYLFENMPASSFQFLLLDAGECLIDDLKVVGQDGKVAIDESFDGETSAWRAFGTHRGSGVVRESPLSKSPCYRIVASGRGNTRHNYVSLALDPELTENARYTVSFRARWLSGCPLLLSRTSGQGLARTNRLPLPPQRGTPGRPNSVAAVSPPIVGAPAQEPIAPRSDQPVRLDVPITARASIVRAEVRYRHESMTEWRTSALRRKDALRWSGTIPSLPKGRVEFAVVAEDAEGRHGVFPAGGTDRPAQFAVDIPYEPGLPAFTVLVSDREWEAARDRERMSNRLMDATLVYGTSRIFYNVGFRARGSGFTRGSRNWRLVFGAETLDGRSELTFDGQGRDAAKMNERLTFWLLDQVDVPTPRQRYVQMQLYGQRGESGVYEEVEKVNGDFLARWFPAEDGAGRPVGLLYKVDDYWDFRPPVEDQNVDGDRRRGRGGFGGFGGFGRRNGNFVEAYLRYQTADPEDYRWNFPPRANGNTEDFAPLIDLIRLVDPEKTELAEFLERVESVVDVDQWTRILAGRTLANDWDAYGLQRGKNAYLYRAPSGRWHLLPWDSDLSWAGRGFGRFSRETSLFSEKFPAVQRLLAQPAYRRRFLGHLAFLATKRLEPKSFATVVRELEEQVGVRARTMIDAAATNRQRILEQMPEVEFRVERVERVARDNQPDVVRISGTAPLLVHALRLGGREGTSRFIDERAWTADFEAGPEDGEVELEAVDRDGDRVAAVTVAVPRGAE